MPFPLLHLPQSLREKIYAHYLAPCGCTTTTPDHLHTKRHSTNPSHKYNSYARTLFRETPCTIGTCTINTALLLLLTSHLIHIEATVTLYHNRTFYFSDTWFNLSDRPCKHAPSTSPACPICTTHATLVRHLRDTDNGLNNTYYEPYERTLHSGILACEFIFMHAWLERIGERNRGLIRSLHLHFGGKVFTHAPTPGQVSNKLLGHFVEKRPSMIAVNGGRPFPKYPFDGGVLLKALRLLAGGRHGLESVKITMWRPDEGFDRFYTDELVPSLRMQKAYYGLWGPGSAVKMALCSFGRLSHGFQFGVRVPCVRGEMYDFGSDMPGYTGEERVGDGSAGFDTLAPARKGLWEVERKVSGKVAERRIHMTGPNCLGRDFAHIHPLLRKKRRSIKEMPEY